MSPIERQLTLLMDARMRQTARAFLAVFVALSMLFSVGAGMAGPVNVALAAGSGGDPVGQDTVSFGNGKNNNSWFTVKFYGVQYDYDNGKSTWHYSITYHGGSPEPSHLVVLTCNNLKKQNVLNHSADFSYGLSVGKDGSTNKYGIKFEIPDKKNSKKLKEDVEAFFTFTLDGLYKTSTGSSAGVVVKAGNSYKIAAVPTPSCNKYEPKRDLSITKQLMEPASGPATEGSPVVFRITVKNTGDLTLQNILVTDTFNSEHLQFVSVEGADARSNVSQVTWTIGSLGKDQSESFDVHFVAKKATTLKGTTNKAEARVQISKNKWLTRSAEATVKIVKAQSQPDPDPNPEPDPGQDPEDDGQEPADNDDGQDPGDDGQEPGDNGDGQDPDDDVQEPGDNGDGQDPEDDGQEPGDNGDGQDPEDDGQEPDDNDEDPADDGQDPVDEPGSGEEPVDEPVDEPGSRNSRPVIRTTSAPQVDLAVTKMVDNAEAGEGEQVVFTVTVTNLGPGSASDVIVSDVLPEGLEYLSHEASQGEYDPISGQWLVGDLAAGDSATLTVAALVGAETAGLTLVNTARVVSSNPGDSNPDNDEASASVMPPALVLMEEEEPLAGPAEGEAAAEAPPLPVTGGSAAMLMIPGILSFAAGLYLRRRFL